MLLFTEFSISVRELLIDNDAAKKKRINNSLTILKDKTNKNIDNLISKKKCT